MSRATPSNGFEFTDKQIGILVDALNFMLMNDEEACEDCIDEALMMSSLLSLYLVDAQAKKVQRSEDIKNLEGLFHGEDTIA